MDRKAGVFLRNESGDACIPGFNGLTFGSKQQCILCFYFNGGYTTGGKAVNHILYLDVSLSLCVCVPHCMAVRASGGKNGGYIMYFYTYWSPVRWNVL